jgi:uncharacterized protein YdeI (YjbR/CyaY-like superfamily)
MTGSKLTTFKTPAALRAWLRRNHATAGELILRCARTHAAAQGITYPQALDEALCYGWIDGVRHRVDTDSFSVRFSPRKARSVWSRLNVTHARRLIRTGRMARPGLAAFRAREERRTGLYSFERPPARLAPAYGRLFRADEGAWSYFQAQSPSYRRTSIHWVLSARREETRARRLGILIECSARGKRIPQLARNRPGEGAQGGAKRRGRRQAS